MTRPARPTEQRRQLDTICDLLARFTAAHPTITTNLRDWTNGTTTTGGPGPKNTISDPTGNTALTVDHWATIRTRVDDHVRTLYRLACDLERVRQEVAAPPLPKQPEQRGLAHCANPNCPDDAWAVKAGRCEPCYRYRLRTDRDRRTSGAPDDR